MVILELLRYSGTDLPEIGLKATWKAKRKIEDKNGNLQSKQI